MKKCFINILEGMKINFRSGKAGQDTLVRPIEFHHSDFPSRSGGGRCVVQTAKILAKRGVLLFLCACFCLLSAGCTDATKLTVAHISDITGALSTDYAIKVVLDEDDRVKDKFVGMQIMSSVEGLALKFGEELGDDYTLLFPKKDYWYNLTYLISQTNGVGKEAGYLGYEEYGDRVFRFSANENAELTFRMVAGQTKKNKDTNEEILVLSEPISDEVKIEIKKAEK